MQSTQDRKRTVASSSRKPVPKPAGGGKLRGNPRESEAVRTSKTLSWILRHGAKTEGIYMREDGYVRVTDLVSAVLLDLASVELTRIVIERMTSISN